MVQASKTLLLIDGNNLFHRAYHALPPLNDKSGENANAVFGFSNMILKATSEVKPEYIACAFDTKALTFRHVEFEAYKAQRVTPPPDLYPQLPKVKRVLEAFGIKYFEKEGFEADDLLATIAAKVLAGSVKEMGPAASHPRPTSSLHTKHEIKSNLSTDAAGARRGSPTRVTHFETSKIPINYEPLTINVVILSGDRDLLQLVDGDIKVQAPGWNLSSTTLYGSKEVKEKFGIMPEQMVDYKSMTGDPSDNVPGIAGIGPKIAAALLQKYKTLEGIYDHLDEISGTVRDKLEKDKEIALAAKKLVRLDCNVDISFQLSELRFDPDWQKVIMELEGLGFKSIVAKLDGTKASEVTNVSKVENASKGQKSEKKNSDQLELI